MTLKRDVFERLKGNRPGRALVAITRSAMLTVRGEPTWVRYDQRSSGWVHRSRRGCLTLAEPRGLSVRGWEELNRSVFLRDYTPQRGDVVVEVGAGVGTETLSLSRLVGPAGRVIAVEAHPATFAMLRRTVDLNHLTNTTTIQAAAMDKGGTVAISDRDISETQTNRIGDEGLPVPAVTLDALLAEHHGERVDFLKMNIEGAETRALRGAPRTLAVTQHAAIGCHDFLADETGDDSYRTMDDVREILAATGLTVDRRVDDRPWAAGYLYADRL